MKAVPYVQCVFSSILTLFAKYNTPQLNEWVELNRPADYVDVMVNLEKKERFTRAVEEAGIVSSVLIEDVQERIKRHVTMNKRSADGLLLLILASFV